MQMELLEMELIKKLQNTQAIQKQAYSELEQALQMKGASMTEYNSNREGVMMGYGSVNANTK